MSPTLRTTCPRDCPDACAILAEVEGDRVLRLRGDPAHPVTRGFLCSRTSRFPARQHAGDRILGPLVRQNGGLVPIGWDEALGLAAERLARVLDEDGPAGLCHLRSGGSLGLLKGLTDRWFRSLGPVTEVVGDICSGAGEAAQELDFGVWDSHDLFDLRHSRRLWLWGRNLGVSWLHAIPLIHEGLARGLTVRNFDPVPPAPGLPAQDWTAIRPGGDVALALAIGRCLLERRPADFEAGLKVPVEGLAGYAALCRRRDIGGWAVEAGVPAELCERLAAELLEGPVAQWIGWGLQRRRRGGLAVRCIDALAALSGNLGVPGGGVSFSFRRRDVVRPEAYGEIRPEARRLSVTRLGRELAAAREPRVGFLWVSNMNPVAMLPESEAVAAALRGVGFTVVVDSHPNDTTACADLVLPSTTFLEEKDLVGAYGHHFVGRAEPVVARPEGPRTDLEIVAALGRRLGRGEPLEAEPEAWIGRILRPGLAAQGLDWDGLAGGARRNPRSAEVLFADGRVPTPSGRVRLVTDEDWAPAPEPPPGFPLWLFSNSTRRAQSSQWITDEAGEGPLPVRVHPKAAPGLPDGAPVLLVGPAARLPARLVHDERLRPDCAVVPKGGSLGLGRAANALVEAVETDLGGGAAYLDAWVRIEPV